MTPNGNLQTAPRTPCAEIRPGDSVTTSFLLATLEQRAKKNGDPFFSMTLRDATGMLPGVMWENHDHLSAGKVRAEDFVRVEASAQEYNGAVQLTVRRIDKLDETSVNPADFLPVSPVAREELADQLDRWMAEVTPGSDCRRLLDFLFGHEKLRAMFLDAPAAARNHQAYIGGLAEHTFNVLRNALGLAEGYKPYDRDLLIAGTLIHDIGKVREFSWQRAITYSDEGRLVGHIPLGAMMVDNAIRQLQREGEEPFSERVRMHLLHLILSHHGKLEYGAPVVPKTREALILHYADYTDAYLTSYVDAADAAQARGERWTPYHRMFESYLFAGAPDENPPADPATTPSATES